MRGSPVSFFVCFTSFAWLSNLGGKEQIPLFWKAWLDKIPEASANFNRPAVVAVHIVTNVRKGGNALRCLRLVVHFLVEGGSAEFLRPKKQTFKQVAYIDLL